jgi:ATP-dependent exoDNAse (exonuclease V) alpha subunit
VHPDETALQAWLAERKVTSLRSGERVAVVADTREQTSALNAVFRSRLVSDQRVDDTRAVTTQAGERIGVGDRIATRRNDGGLGVANRDAWIVTAIDDHGQLSIVPGDVTPDDGNHDNVTPGGGGMHGNFTRLPVRPRVLPADYVARFVELAYASTAYGVQGDTVSAAHLVVGERTGAAAAYVGMTRGRHSNTAHLVAEDLADAREQWIAVFARGRADLGPAHAAELAAREAARCAEPLPREKRQPERPEEAAPHDQCADTRVLPSSIVDVDWSVSPPESAAPRTVQPKSGPGRGR